ncbi:hypothetical protein [Thermoleophilum album]|uniref:hypothetical protein n=1 Tax=Thermoleophilum album TaxID=29539 RepID=UPI000B850A38|nr:hypothetical protein [Thermoleophilum album]
MKQLPSGHRGAGAESARRTTRRRAIGVATAAASAFLTAAPIARARPVAGAPRAQQLTRARRLLAVERAALAHYRSTPRTVPLDADQMVAVELAHVQRLERLLRRLGGEPAQPAPAPRVPQARDQWLAAVARLERAALSGYEELVVALDDDVFLVPIASAACADAQQLALVERARGIELPAWPPADR